VSALSGLTIFSHARSFIVELERDNLEKPEGGVATIMADEFFNVYDKTGPGMSNYKP
jgi:hypothetical protein